MTKLDIIIKNPESLTEKKVLSAGAYLATFSKPNDRIVLINSQSEIKAVLKADFTGTLVIPHDPSLSLYRNLKKLKRITVEVELDD